MKKLILTVLFLALSAFTVYYFGFRKGSTINQSEKQFALTESENIDRIVLIKDHQKIILDKGQNSWTLNGKEVRSDMINMLIEVSEGLDAIAPVPKEEIDWVNQKLQTGVKVEFYHKGNLDNSFTLCRSDKEIYGLRENFEIPYRISLRGFSTIDLTKIYNTQENFWLTNLLINIEPENIKSVSIDYPLNPGNGFILDKSDNNNYKLIKSQQKKELSGTDSEIISEYLYFFSNIRYYPVEDTANLRQQVITNKNNFFRLVVESINGKKFEVLGYAMPEVDTSQIAPLQFYALDSNSNIISLKFNDFDPILVHADYFLKK